MQDFERHNKNFFSFVDKIGPNEKVGILTHSNCVDGMISAVFLIEILKRKLPNMPAPHVGFIPYKLGILDEYEEIFNLDGIKKVFILDANVDMNQLEETERFFDKFDVMFIDHHPLNPKLRVTEKMIKTHSDDCTSLVLYKLGEKLLEEKEWVELACIAAISEFSFNNDENLKFIQKHYSFDREDYQEEEIFYKVLKLNSLITYYIKDSRKAYEIILNKDYDEIDRVNKEISQEFDRCMKDFEENAERYFNNLLYFYFFKSKFSIGSRLSTTVSVKHKESTIIMLSDIEGTNLIKVSGRSNSKELNYDLGDMIRAGINGLDKAIGGGHPRAVGGSFLKKDIDKFKQNIIGYVENRLK
ncbi:MAG: DHH family phosphoesterase [Nanoarchaeota archaeon]